MLKQSCVNISLNKFVKYGMRTCKPNFNSFPGMISESGLLPFFKSFIAVFGKVQGTFAAGGLAKKVTCASHLSTAQHRNLLLYL